jgi:hypothetical protein
LGWVCVISGARAETILKPPNRNSSAPEPTWISAPNPGSVDGAIALIGEGMLILDFGFWIGDFGLRGFQQFHSFSFIGWLGQLRQIEKRIAHEGSLVRDCSLARLGEIALKIFVKLA